MGFSTNHIFQPRWTWAKAREMDEQKKAGNLES